jgi:hypothetical protein
MKDCGRLSQTANSPSIKVWIGLVGVEPDGISGALEVGKAAYVNAVVPALTKAEYREKVQHALGALHLRPFEFEDIEPLEARLKSFQVPSFMRSLAEQSEKDGCVRFGELFVFQKER